MKSIPNNQARAGFTLVEVLVSSFLTLIIMGMLFAVLMGTISAWEGGTNRLKSSGDARLAMDILKTDLESMVVRQTQYNQEWLVSYPIEESGIKFTWLTFFAPSLDRDTEEDGDIVALSYRIYFQDPISMANIVEIFGLYKAMTDTREAFDNVLGLPNIFESYWQGGSPVPAPMDRSGFLAPNVVDFDIAWWVRHSTSGSEAYELYDSNYYVRLSNVLKIYEEGNNTPVVLGGKLEVAEISLTTLSDEGMRRYAFFVKNGTANAARLNEVVREFGRTHTMRIPINY